MVDAPLAGVKVLELASVFPGPLTGMWLADMGADVIKVEHPRGGDVARKMGPPPVDGKSDSVTFLVANRGKRSMTLNVARPKGRELLRRLLADADVLIESYRPETTRRLGIDHHALCEEFPRLVYIHLSLYGMEGPYAGQMGHDGNVAALTGVLATTGRDAPTLPGVQVADVGGAHVALSSTLAALYQRERTGRGQFVDCSLMDAAFASTTLVAGHLMAAERTAFGRGPLNGGQAHYRVYETRDGAHVVLCALEPRFLDAFLGAAGVTGLAPRVHEGGPTAAAALEELFASRTLAEWAPLFDQASACLSPVRSLEEAMDDPHLRARNMIQELDHPVEGRLLLVGSPFRLRGASPSPTPPPVLSQHTAEVLGDLGYDDEAMDTMRRERVI
jgi:crotonobetainyl-CoA:carnitine CoA-transferase CaiB-like acyl-CoA transferase